MKKTLNNKAVGENRENIAVIKNDMHWVKKEVGEIKSIVQHTNVCLNKVDNRIQKVEDRQDFQDDNFKKGIAKWGVIFGIITFIISLILNLIL